MSTDESLKSLHKALLNFNKRAERANTEILVRNFVDSETLFDLLSTPNNHVVYGRRGTGKTHALKYLAEYVQRAGDHAIYLDLRSIGSNDLSSAISTIRISGAGRWVCCKKKKKENILRCREMIIGRSGVLYCASIQVKPSRASATDQVVATTLFTQLVPHVRS